MCAGVYVFVFVCIVGVQGVEHGWEATRIYIYIGICI